MSEQEIIVPPPQPRRQDARDLQSRLYREIGLAAVEAALFAPEAASSARSEVLAETRSEPRAESRMERPARVVSLTRNAA
jgi:hypothetical protein